MTGLTGPLCNFCKAPIIVVIAVVIIIIINYIIYNISGVYDDDDENSNKLYTGCPRRNVRDFGRVFLMLNYTDITQNTYT
jgi:hypothetical protein